MSMKTKEDAKPRGLPPLPLGGEGVRCRRSSAGAGRVRGFRSNVPFPISRTASLRGHKVRCGRRIIKNSRNEPGMSMKTKEDAKPRGLPLSPLGERVSRCRRSSAGAGRVRGFRSNVADTTWSHTTTPGEARRVSQGPQPSGRPRQGESGRRGTSYISCRSRRGRDRCVRSSRGESPAGASR